MQKISVEVKCHEGVRQLSEPTFNQACDGVDDIVVQTRRLGSCAKRHFRSWCQIFHQISLHLFWLKHRFWQHYQLFFFFYLSPESGAALLLDTLSLTSGIDPRCRGRLSPRASAASQSLWALGWLYWWAYTLEPRSEVSLEYFHPVRNDTRKWGMRDVQRWALKNLSRIVDLSSHTVIFVALFPTCLARLVEQSVMILFRHFLWQISLQADKKGQKKGF